MIPLKIVLKYQIQQENIIKKKRPMYWSLLIAIKRSDLRYARFYYNSSVFVCLSFKMACAMNYELI